MKATKREALQELVDTFTDGGGYGDPEARRNAEMMLQVLIAKEQQRTATKLNVLTLLLVLVGLLDSAVLALQLLRR